MNNKDIAKHINSLLVWDRMVNDRTKSSKDRDDAMRWFNQSADVLIAAGIPVVGYGVEYTR